jgi:hypothetical protein
MTDTERETWLSEVVASSRIFQWDWKEQPDWGDVNDAVQDLWVAGDPPPLIFSVPSTESDQFGLIVTNWGLTNQQKNEVWRYWMENDD